LRVWRTWTCLSQFGAAAAWADLSGGSAWRACAGNETAFEATPGKLESFGGEFFVGELTNAEMAFAMVSGVARFSRMSR